MSSLESFDRIKAMEDSVYNSKVFNPRGVRGLYDVYVAHVAKFPSDTITPHVLLRAANTGKQLNLSDQAIVQYDQILTQFPNWYKVVDAAYMKAFTLDDMPGKVEEAKQAYESVIANYPDHKFANDAKALLENVALTDAEVIRKFESMKNQNAN